MSSLKQKSALAFGWDFLGLLATRGSGFIVSIFLARLLSPEDFGLIGMGMAFIAISQVFVDVGFSSALIQKKSNNQAAYASVFYFNILAGITLFLIFYFLAPLIGLFYGRPEVVPLVQWLSLNFLFNSFGLVQKAILVKELNFKALSIKNLIAALLGGVLGILAALNDYGVYALAIQLLSSALIGTSLLWVFSTWRPTLEFSAKELKQMMGFSSYVFLDGIVSTAFQKLDVFVIAKFLSPASLGFYSRAVSLKDQVTTYSSASIQKIFFPILSSLQDKPKEYERIYYKVVSVVTFVSFFLTAWLMIFGAEVIIGLFGSKWQISVPIFQVLILGVFTYPLNGMIVNAFISKGYSKENFRIGLLRKLIQLFPLSLIPFYGLRGFTIAFVGVSYFLTIVNILFLKKYLGLSIKKNLVSLLDGLLPFLPFALFFYLVPIDSIFGKFLLAFSFTIGYFVYHFLKQTSGFVFIKNNGLEIFKKLYYKFFK